MEQYGTTSSLGHNALTIFKEHLYLSVSKNNGTGTPKSSILIGFSIINHPFWVFSPYVWKHLYFKILNPANPSRYCFHDVVVNTYGRLWFRTFCGSLLDKIKIKFMF